MTNRAEFVDVELFLNQDASTIAPPIDRPGPFRGLLRWQNTPLGTVDAPQRDHLIPAAFPHYNYTLYQELLRRRLAQPQPNDDAQSFTIESALQQAPENEPIPNLKLTIAYCFCAEQPGFNPELRDRNALLNSLRNQTYPHLQILLIEYGVPDRRDSKLEQAIASDLRFEYYAINHSDVEAAQHYALKKCSGDLMSFLDDRTVLDPQWAMMAARVFDRNPDVRLMTGLIVPKTLHRENQIPYESLYGLNAGFARRWLMWDRLPNWIQTGVMQYGHPVNLVLHRSLLESPLMTQSPGLGFQWTGMIDALLQGKLLVYEPRSLMWMAIPETDRPVEQAAYAASQSFYSYLQTGWSLYPHLRLQWFILGLWKLSRVLGAWVKTYGLPRSWFTAELMGIRDRLTTPTHRLQPSPHRPHPKATAKVAQVHTLNLSKPIVPIPTPDAPALRLYVQWCDRLLGFITIDTPGQILGSDQIIDALVEKMLPVLLGIPYPDQPNLVWSQAEQAIANRFTPPTPAPVPDRIPQPLDPTIPISIIVPTCNRPDDLRQCLHHLSALRTDRPVEILVADNRPQTGSAAEVLQEFPNVKLVEEPRVGSSYARNAAIAASTGEIVVTVDDDVRVPPDWLEKLLLPFSRSEVMSVCGGVLPAVLDTPAQVMFEEVKGGLCFGFETREADRAWLDSFRDSVPPVWELGVSANSAFRSSLFSDPQVGLMEESLGAGMPTAGAEENHYTYKILRAGHTVVYLPSAFVWHHHRRSKKAFYKQVQGQMISCSAFNLTLWRQEGDRRGLNQLLFHMPRYFWQCWCDRLFGKTRTPWIILFYEFKGYCMGFGGYLQSRKQVAKLGRSEGYVKVELRVES